MKNFKTTLAVIAISLSTLFTATASENEPSKITSKLRSEIATILGEKIPLDVKQNINTEFTFMINNKNEIVIISVDSSISSFNSYVKNKLNYKKLAVKGLKKGEIYRMPVKIKTI